MYRNLYKLNLENYIKNFCGGNIVEDPYLRKLDDFIVKLTKENIQVLEKKFKGNKQFCEITNLLHEIEIAYLSHPSATFREEPGADLEDGGTFIEVKSLNESEEERQRHKSNSFSDISSLLSDGELQKERLQTIEAIKNKTINHLKKAIEQICKRGLVYLIWDYNTFIYSEKKSVHKNGALRKEDVESFISQVTSDFTIKYPDIKFKQYYFGDLRNMIVTHIPQMT